MQEIKLYTTTYCGFCRQAKQMLTTLKVPFNEISLDGKDDLRQELSQANGGWRTVPMIFVGEEFIGGYQDMYDLHKQGKFLPKVER